jgi:hypothetical protein
MAAGLEHPAFACLVSRTASRSAKPSSSSSVPSLESIVLHFDVSRNLVMIIAREQPTEDSFFAGKLMAAVPSVARERSLTVYFNDGLKPCDAGLALFFHFLSLRFFPPHLALFA